MLVPVIDFGTNPGALDMYEHAPANLPTGRPLVVVLHGCTQEASGMETAGWNALADQLELTVVYAQQRQANHPLRCFTWYSDSDITRDSGEAKSVMQMVDHAIAAHGSDPARVYVTGVSAGGALTSVMLATYPERFAAGSMMAAVPYRCGTDLLSAQACTMMSPSAQRTPMQWGDLVRAENPGFAGPFPRVQIFQGANDTTVAPANAIENVKQWTNVWGIDATADATATIGPATRTQYTAGTTVAVELYSVAGMGHAIAVGDDGSGPCPASTGTFFVDVGLCSTLRAAEFFGLADVPDPPDMDPGNNDPDEDAGEATASRSGCSATRESPSLLLLLLAACALVGRGNARRCRPSRESRSPRRDV